MSKKVDKIDILNKVIFNNLESILKNLDKRIHIKLYALVFDQKQTLINQLRIKKTIPIGENSATISQETLQKVTDIYAELKINPNDIKKNTYDDIKKYVNKIWDKQKIIKETDSVDKIEIGLSDMEGEKIINTESYINENSMLYANKILYQTEESLYSIVYIIELRNIEHEIRNYFYKKPEISFLRMILDYFFNDFLTVSNNAVQINDNNTVSLKYNEGGIQLNRRITRLFFGKIQIYLQEGTRLNDFGSEFDHEPRDEYYVNSLMEKIDDISNLTYENSNPFGSILFLNKQVIAENIFIHFTVKFTKEDRIGLEDAKRIRKLLEITNIEKDLYLIADEKEVYGLGEVNWNMQKDELALRLDFNGLSKYNLVLVRTDSQYVSRGKLFFEDEKKVFRSDLNLIEVKLLSVSFKNPRIGEEGYSSEKFINLLKGTFWNYDIDIDQIKHKLDRLDQIVKKAREQKHGTMVVITDDLTAKQELNQLSKQSTLIEPRTINPEYIKYLTAIDGAIYFDTDGLCYAIGVILDGIAKDNIGDASRGARYNSAHRYLHKLKEDKQKKGVIVIISEDGTVDLIPESEHEDMLLTSAEEIIDMISEESKEENKLKELKEKEDILLCSKIVDYDWLFNIAHVYYVNKKYERAIDFFKYGIERAEKSFILPEYYNFLGNSYSRKDEKEYLEAIKMYKLAIEKSEDNRANFIYISNLGYSHFLLALKLKDNKEEYVDKLNEALEYCSQAIGMSSSLSIKPETTIYDIRARSYFFLSETEKDPKVKIQLMNYSIKDFSEAISINSESSHLYWNRSLAYNQSNQKKECMEDIIQAEYLKHNDKYIARLSTMLETSPPEIVSEIINFHKDLARQNKEPVQLSELIDKHHAIVEIKQHSEAAVGRELESE